MTHGRVQAVHKDYVGAYLVANAGIGATTLLVDDLSCFEDTGGVVQLTDGVNTETDILYTGLDYDLVSLLGVSGVSNAYALDDTTVRPYPLHPQVFAEVQLEGEDEAVQARVGMALIPLLPLGFRDLNSTSESVDVANDGEEYVVVDILGTDPIGDGSYLDPLTIPPAPITDLLPPGSSPALTVIPMLTQFFLKWTGITNHDAVTYEIHCSKTAGFTPSSTTKVGETGSTIATIRQQCSADGGGNLAYSTNYYLRLVAKDPDGSAAAGAQVGPYQINKLFGSDISAGAITADKITAGDITAALTLSGYMGSAAKGDATQHWEADGDGVRLIGPAGQLLAELPTDPLKPVKVVGDLTAGSLESAMATLHGLTSLDIGAVMEASSSLSNPVSQPSVVHSVESMAFAATAPVGEIGIGLGWDGTYFTYLQSDSIPSGLPQQVFYRVNTSGTILSSTLLDTSLLDGDQKLFSLVKVGSWWYGIGGWTPRWLVFADSAGMPAATPTTSGLLTQWRGWYREPLVATDGTNLYVCQSNRTGSGGAPNDKMWIGMYTAPAGVPAFLSNVTTDIEIAEGSPAAFVVSNADIGAARYWVQSTTGTRVRSFNASGLVQSAEEWYTSGASDGGIVWDGTQFRSRVGNQRLLYKYTNFRSTNGPWTAFAVAYTWYDSAGTVHESALSPRKIVNLYSRWRISVSWPTIPSGGADDPNSVRIYMNTSGTDPGGLWSSYFIQGTTFTGVQTYLTAFSSTTAGPGSVTVFPASIPAIIRAESSEWELRGNGTQ